MAVIALAALLLGAFGHMPAMAQESRSFYMGFTPHPHDYTEQAFAETYERISANGDIIAHHLDEGVPWSESLNGDAYPKAVMADLNRRKTGTPPGKAVFLSVTPLSLTRKDIAGNWGQESHMPLPAAFTGKALDDPMVIDAFTNYCLRMIDFFKPRYMAYAIEVSDLTQAGPAADQFVRLAQAVYGRIKDRHPNLPVFPTFTLGDRNALDGNAKRLIRDLLPYSDVIAVSTYPYVWDGIGGDASAIPADWFTKIADLGQGKPFAIAETGFIGGSYSNLRHLVWISSDPQSQKVYVERLLKEANALNAEFVVWYVPVDYDLLWEKMKAQGMDTWFAQWMRAGLWQADFSPRPGFEIWNFWLNLPRR